MTFYLLCSSEMPQTFLRILHEQLSNQVFDFKAEGELGWKLYFLIEDSLLCSCFWGVGFVEWRAANDHLEEQSPQTVVIDLEGVPLSNEDFWAHILQASTKRVSFFFGFLGQSKVSDLEMPSDVHHDVFRFQIAVDNILGMEVLNC